MVMLAHHDFGGVGPKLLLLHANGFHGHTLKPMAQYLNKQFHCIAFDLVGHGASSSLPDGQKITVQSMVDSVLETVQLLGLEGCYCFGHSCGGAIALLMAAAASSHAHMGFTALYCYEAVASAVPLSLAEVGPEVMSGLALRRRNRWPSYFDAIVSLGSKPPFSLFRTDAFLAYVQHGVRPVNPGTSESAGSVELSCTRETEASVFRAYRPPVSGDWSNISCPVIIAIGGANGPFNYVSKLGPELAASLPIGCLHEFGALGHLGPMEDPALVAQHIAESFLKLAAPGQPNIAARL